MTDQASNPGGITNFDSYLPSLLNWADFLIQSDEIEKAEWLLTKGMPGFYRDNPPEAVRRKLEKLYQFLMNVADYAANPKDVELVGVERAKSIVDSTIRGTILLKEIEALNQQGIEPTLYEMGPGEFWIPIGLKAKGCKFKYGASYLSYNAANRAREYLKDEWIEDMNVDGYRIFIACEVIEHLRRETEILHTLYKIGWKYPDQIHLSTPRYTFGGGMPNWDSNEHRGLGGHFRTYTPNEFHSIACELFPGYTWNYLSNEIQSLVGKRNSLNGVQ